MNKPIVTQRPNGRIWRKRRPSEQQPELTGAPSYPSWRRAVRDYGAPTYSAPRPAELQRTVATDLQRAVTADVQRAIAAELQRAAAERAVAYHAPSGGRIACAERWRFARRQRAA